MSSIDESVCVPARFTAGSISLRVLIERGGPGDAAGAEAQLRTTAALADELGMSPAVRAATSLL